MNIDKYFNQLKIMGMNKDACPFKLKEFEDEFNLNECAVGFLKKLVLDNRFNKIHDEDYKFFIKALYLHKDYDISIKAVGINLDQEDEIDGEDFYALDIFVQNLDVFFSKDKKDVETNEIAVLEYSVPKYDDPDGCTEIFVNFMINTIVPELNKTSGGTNKCGMVGYSSIEGLEGFFKLVKTYKETGKWKTSS